MKLEYAYFFAGCIVTAFIWASLKVWEACQAHRETTAMKDILIKANGHQKTNKEGV